MPRARRLRSLIVGFVSFTTVLAAAQAAQQQPPNAQTSQQPPPKGTGFMLGQVVDAGSNRPVAGATVNLGGGSVTTVQLPTGEVITTSALPPGTPGATPVAPRQIITDGNGRFLFRELNQGTYTLRSSAPGYIAAVYGQNRPSGASQSIVLERDDEKRAGLILRMWKGGTVSGRLMDEAGDPAVVIPVQLIRRTIVAGRTRLMLSTVAQTDDRGMYRFANLAPGDYLVGVLATATTLPAAVSDAYMQSGGGSAASEDMMREYQSSGAPYPFTTGFRVGDLIFTSTGRFGEGGTGSIPPPQEDGRVLAYPTVFYPSVSTPQQATVITLGSGEDRSGIDLQLKLRRTIIVSGVVTGPDGPVKNVGLKLLPAGAEDYASTTAGFEAAVTASDASGRFTFLGVIPGTYTVQCVRVPRVQAPRSQPMTTVEVSGPNGMIMGMSSMGPGTAPILPLPTDPTLWGGMSVTVGDSDIQNLAVTLRPGARLSGRIVFEGASEVPPPDVVQRVSLQISQMAGVTPSQVLSGQKRVETDGTFRTVGYPPGRYSLAASIPPAPGRVGGPSWRFKFATLSGKDLSDEGLDLQGEDLGNIVITFTDRPTEVAGNVVDLKGQPDLAAMVIVIPADSQAWKSGIVSPRRVRGVRTTTTGAFTIADLPPGEYFIAAVSDAALDNWQDPKNLESISRLSTRITVADGAKISQRLTTVAFK